MLCALGEYDLAKQFTWSGLVVDLLRMKTSAGR